MHNAVLIESHVDYLTATCLSDSLHEEQSFDRALEFAYDMVQTEERKGNDKKLWRSESFEGYRSGQICVGRNERGLLFRLSGRLAAEHWRDVYRDASNVSRIDCAATVKLEGAWTDLSRTHHYEALQYQKEHSPKLRVTRIDGGKHGCTLNVGSRSSNAYARIYDKAAESGLEYYDSCWRYELEAKKAYALQVAARLASDDHDGLGPAAIVHGWLLKRHLRPVGIETDYGINMPVVRYSDDGRRMDWIRRSVRPGVEHLIANGNLSEVLDALGLSELVSVRSVPVESQSI